MMKEKDQAALLKDALVAEFRRRVIEECAPRLKKCLGELSEEQIWQRPNENSNAVGNLVLHLCGNARQWILTGLGAAPDHRQRQSEFDARGGFTRAELAQTLDDLMLEMNALLDRLSVEDMLRKRPVQIYEESGASILMHVMEHFAYHTGQVSFWVKALKNKDLGYYAGQNLGGRTRASVSA